MKTKHSHVIELLELYRLRQDAIKSRLEEFKHVPPSEYFFELAYCLLTPQSSAAHAEKAVEKLRESGFPTYAVDPEPILREKSNYIRFHKTKARLLERLKEDYARIGNALSNGNSPSELREWLVKNVRGLGYKEATHFLRNIGRNGGLAILDRHILRNLRRFGAIRSLPKTLTRRQYFRIEQRFITFSERIGIPIDELDLLFWSMETGEIRK
ncbi:MAG TPA: DNA lyase [Bacteroidota bacterium]|nr:DNA lyase [Bacteroidota bacterium]